jgi:2-(1,2-epoxy-1,2-dihydrophenyl)acetyl-CoA isomerase
MVVPTIDVVGRAQAIARRLASGPRTALAQIRHLHASAFDNSLAKQIEAERSAQDMSIGAPDCVEGVRAFFEKREPHFSAH